MDDGKASGLTGVFQRLMDSGAQPAAGDPADLGTSYGLEVSLAQRDDGPPPRSGAWAWLRRRGQALQTSTSRKGS